MQHCFDRGQGDDAKYEEDKVGPGEHECMLESLGTDVMAQFGPGGRDPTREEEAKMQHCFPG